jgi:hypothetical protein
MPISLNKPVQAFINVLNDLFNIEKNGSLTGYFFDPHNVTCSRICATPVESVGIVLNVTLEMLKKRFDACYKSIILKSTIKLIKKANKFRNLEKPEKIICIVGINMQMFGSSFLVTQFETL